MTMQTTKVWEEKVIIPTYEVGLPDQNPMFFERRVYQGSSGAVYPNPIIEKIFDQKIEKEYHALYLENKYLKIMILPELGGRVQMAFDKIKQRHFVYYNQVIKPALVGLTGPWISGGIEFNWPQHHRPSTFERVDFKIEENEDGSKTIWINEIEKMFRTKGMAGFTIYPDRAYLEIKAQLYNRTCFPQTFLWWANPAVKVNDDYQSVFPSDVNAVFDHGKRDVASFPLATGIYYKVDYSPGTDISKYKNIPVPTSYMAINSEYDFVGGYEHDTKAGLLHVADHHVSPGKKQWTWGHGDFGKAWGRNLTDEDGPYIELMTGMFTDNQPDFSWLMPFEEKTFTQYFLPYRELGVIKNATKDVLLGLSIIDRNVTVKIMTTSKFNNLEISLIIHGQVNFETKIGLSPEQVFEKTIPYPEIVNEINCMVLVKNEGLEMVRFDPKNNSIKEMPQPAKAAKLPFEIENNEQLFLTGQHLEQYRHATYNPVDYYEEALHRDSKDIRNNNALGLWYMRRGQYAKAESYFKTAVETVTDKNPNPYNGEPLFNLALCLFLQEQFNAAYTHFFKATWSAAWQDAAFFYLAVLSIRKREWSNALKFINHSLDKNARNSKAYTIKSVILRKLNLLNEAKSCCELAIKRDGFNLGCWFELALIDQETTHTDTTKQHFADLANRNPNNYIEFALDYANLELYKEAIALLLICEDNSSANFMVYYHLAYFYFKINEETLSNNYLQKASTIKPNALFANKLEDITALKFAVINNPKDGFAPYHLGNLWYDKKNYDEAVAMWEISTQRNPKFPTSYRNLGIASFNKRQEFDKALAYYEKAFLLDTSDARVLMELDQLKKRLNYTPKSRLTYLSNYKSTVEKRDDLYLEKLALQNFMGNHHTAFEMLKNRIFHPWEGGEGKVTGQYVNSIMAIAMELIKEEKFENAIDLLQKAKQYPHNLGEGKLPATQENDIDYWIGCAYEGYNNVKEARKYFEMATIGNCIPCAAIFYNDQQPHQILYQGLAWKKIGENTKANHLFENLMEYGQTHLHNNIKLDYFAVSLPDLLLFDTDLNQKNQALCYYLSGLGKLGMQEWIASAEFFKKTLAIDSSHFGAKTHVSFAHSWSLIN